MENLTAHPELANGPPPVQPPRPTPILGILPAVWQNPWNKWLPAENLWRGYLNGQSVEVWVGAVHTLGPNGTKLETQQGYVAVGVGENLGAGADYHEYITPTQHGGLKITAVNGTKVSLVAKDGTTFTFNLDTRTFS